MRKLLQDGVARDYEAAVDITAKTYPEYFGSDMGASLANFIKRGQTHRKLRDKVKRH